MHTDDDAGPPRRYRPLLLATLVALVAVVAVVVLRGAGGFDRLLATDGKDLTEQLADAAVAALEQAPRSEHGEYLDPAEAAGSADSAGQGHPLAAEPGRYVCVAETFGYDPAQASSVAEVRAVYVHHMCAAVGPGLAWPGAIRGSGPVAVALTDPVTVQVPEQALPDAADATYDQRVRAVIPERYHGAALSPGESAGAGLAERLRERFDAVSDGA